MIVLLSALPILSTILALIFGARSLHAALLGVSSAALAIVLAFPIPPESFVTMASRWLPVLVEVLMIVAGGLLLSEVVRQAGGQAALATWVRTHIGQDVRAVLLVVHGITPFAESLTGFGIGITIGVPLLANFGLPVRKVAIIGLLGLCAVPWGSMGPGTLIAANMSGLSFYDLGVTSAIVSVIPFTVTGCVAAWLAASGEGRGLAILQGALSGIVLTVSVTAANVAFGTPSAGAMGALVVIALHILRGTRLQNSAPLESGGRATLWTYAILLGGVLVSGWAVHAADLSESWRYVSSPALWLFLAALWLARGSLRALPLQRTWASWIQVAPVTGLFIVLGVLMAMSGIAAFLAQTLAGVGTAYLVVAPFVAALGGFVTGSNSGANAMFASTQAEIARSLGVDVLWFMGIHNVAAAFLLMASPGKVEMAIQLASAEASERRSQIQLTVLGVAFLVVAMLAFVILFLF